MSQFSKVQSLLGSRAEFLLGHVCKTVPKEVLHIPSSTFVDDVWGASDRKPMVLRSLQALFSHGRATFPSCR
jgi:fructose-bisphosphate aldolase, class I